MEACEGLRRVLIDSDRVYLRLKVKVGFIKLWCLGYGGWNRVAFEEKNPGLCSVLAPMLDVRQHELMLDVICGLVKLELGDLARSQFR